MGWGDGVGRFEKVRRVESNGGILVGSGMLCSSTIGNDIFPCLVRPPRGYLFACNLDISILPLHCLLSSYLRWATIVLVNVVPLLVGTTICLIRRQDPLL